MALNIIVSEVGANLVVSGSGTINLTALSLVSSGSTNSLGLNTNPGEGRIISDDASSALFDIYSGFTPSTFFGSNIARLANLFSGDSFGIDVTTQQVYVPSGYLTGSAISGSMQINGQTLATAGFLAGTYTYSWGSGGSADSIIINAVASVTPTPTPTVTNTASPTPTPSQTGTIPVTPTNTSSSTPTPSVTKTSTPTPTVTNTNTPTQTASVTPTQTGTPAVTPSPTSSVTPTLTPTQTASPTPSITPSAFGVFYANEYYEFTGEMFGSYSGGTYDPSIGTIPHPANQAMIGGERGTVYDESSITLGGFNGLNN